MADSGLQGIVQSPDYGRLLTALPLADSEIATQSAQQNVARANVGNIQANTDYTGAQTQGANIANQNAALNLQLYKQALNAPPIGNPNAIPGGNLLSAMGGSNAPAAAAPQSGVAGSNAAPAAAAPQSLSAALDGQNAPPAAPQTGAPLSNAAGPQSNIHPDHPADYPTPAELAEKAQARYAPTVQPFAPDERVQVMQGLASPNPFIKQRTQAFVDARTGAMSADNAQKNQSALQDYNKLTMVASRDDGTAFTLMQRFSPDVGKVLAARNPNDFIIDSNGNITANDKGEADTRAYAASLAGMVHPYTGRGIETTPAGVVIDKVDGKPVTGVNQVTNLGGKEIAEIAARGHAKVDTLINGQPAQLEQWQMDKAPDYSTWLQHQLDQAKSGIQSGSQAASTSSPGGAMPGAPQTAAPKVSAGAASPSPAGPASNALPNGLPGVDLNALPKRQTFSIPQGQSATADQKAQLERDNAQTTSLLQSASESSANNAKMRSLLTSANAELAKINPRTVGPGSDIYNSYLKFKAGVTGGSPNDLVNEQELDKYLNQVGAQNVRTMLSGQKITNQEMMTFMSRGSPNTDQSVQTIKNLVNYLNADNEYDSRLQATKIAALKKGADPWSINDALETASPRSNYIQGRTGLPLHGPGQGNPNPASANDKTVTRTGMLNGKKVVQYSDGSVSYAQ
jgi:hypothetical protein